MRPALDVVGMLVFGLVMLAVPAWLFEVRTHRPVPATEAEFAAVAESAAETGAGKRTGLLDGMAKGLLLSMAKAHAMLGEGRRSDAMHALDAALRSAMVARETAEKAAPFESALDAVRRVRRSVQNGAPEMAERHLGEAVSRLRDATARGVGSPTGVPADIRRYVGALVINAEGETVGKVSAVFGSADARQLVIDVGGIHDVFGVFDLSPGNRLDVPAVAFLFGRRKGIGNTFVALPIERRSDS